MKYICMKTGLICMRCNPGECLDRREESSLRTADLFMSDEEWLENVCKLICFSNETMDHKKLMMNKFAVVCKKLNAEVIMDGDEFRIHKKPD